MLKHTKKILIILLSIILIGLIVFVSYKDRNEIIVDSGESPNGKEFIKSLSYNGESLFLKDDVETYLIIGVDGETLPEYEDSETSDFYNYMQADMLLVLVVDNDEQTVTPIQINRDTMTDVPWLGVEGDIKGSQYEQIAFAYNSGSGRNDSCEVTCSAVSSLLFGAPIEHYMSFPLEAISLANDVVGGVTVTFDDNLTVIDSSFIKGETLKLNGSQAEKFVRARGMLSDDTNISRMSRQRKYLSGFIDSAKLSYESDNSFLSRALAELSPYLVTDMSVESISVIIDKLDKYTVNPFEFVDGVLVINEFYEFYINKDDLWVIVKSVFCNAKKIA